MNQNSTLQHAYFYLAIFAGMSLIPWVAIPMDVAWGPAKAMGRILNSGLIFSFIFIVALSGALKTLRNPSERGIMLFLAAFLCIATLGTRNANVSTILTYSEFIAIFGAGAAGLCAYALARDGIAPLKASVLFIALGLAPMVSLPWLIAHNISDHSAETWYLNVYGFTNVRAIGHFASIGIAILAPFALLRRDRVAALAAVGSALLWSMLFWSGSRAGVVALIIPLFVVILLNKNIILALISNVTWAVLGAIISTGYPIPGANFGIFSRAKSTLHTLSNNPSLDGLDRASSGRLDIWSWAIDRILEKPFTGWGFGVMDRLPGAPDFYHTHNIVLEYAFAFGIPVASAVIALLVFLTWKAWKATCAAPTSERVALFSLCLLLPIYSLMSGVLINPYPLTVYLVALGLTATLPRPLPQDLSHTTPGEGDIKADSKIADLFPEE